MSEYMSMKDVAMLRGKELFENKNSSFDSFKEAFDIALEEMIIDCKLLMFEDEASDFNS